MKALINNMNKEFRRIVVVIFLLLLFSSPTFAIAENMNVIEEEISCGSLIKTNDSEAAENMALECVADGIYRTDDLTQIMCADLNLIQYTEPDYEISLFDTPSVKDFDAMWSHDVLGIEYATSEGLNGKDVRIAVIDSGIDAQNKNINNESVENGFDYLRKTSLMSDSYGHGTYVAQVLCGIGDCGVKGVSQKAALIPLRCFSNEKSNISYIIQAIYDAVDIYHCDIINMSFGMESESVLLHEAIQYAYESGVIMVAAAGNVTENAEQGTIFYPAAFPEVIGVGAINHELMVSAFSQQTTAVSVCAPGEGLIMISPSGSPIMQSGTSFAAPFVTGEIALLKQLDGHIDAYNVDTILRERSVDLGETGYDTIFGYGLPNIIGLIGETWYHHFLDANSCCHVSGWYFHNNGSNIISSSYSYDGKMLDCFLIGSDGSINSFDFIIKSSATTIKLFFLDCKFSPLAQFIVFDSLK